MKKLGKIFMLPTLLGGEDSKMVIPIGVFEVTRKTSFLLLKILEQHEDFLKPLTKI
jgi:hypothetical protein